jgi:hypothetical protein
MKVSPFQVIDAKFWSGMTTDNHIHAIYTAGPQEAGSLVNRMLEATFGPSLETILSKYPAEYFERDDEFYWKLMGSFDRNIPLVEARWKGAVVTDQTVGVGSNRTEIELVFGEKWFDDGMVIVGEKNEIYPLYIKSIEREGSGNYVHVCEIALANADGMPGEELTGGKLFSIEFSPVERTLSVKGTGIRHTTPIEMRGSFTTIRKEEKVPGNMVSRKMAAFWKNPVTGKSDGTWMEYLDWRLEWELMLEKNRAMFFGRTNRDAEGRTYMTGKSGNDIFIGPGIREQMEVSNTLYYNKFSLKLLENMLFDISEGKLKMDERHFIIKTGERGAAVIHKAIKNEASGWIPLRDSQSMYSVKSDFARNARGFGFQFTEWIAPNGIKVTVEVDELYTDFTRNKIVHPDGGRAESYRMDIFDIGTTDGAPNIQKAYVRGMENILRYEVGMRSPWDAATKNIISNSEDSYTIHRMCQFGTIVRDPQRTASLIPQVLSA